jgi:hypothetical protein
MWRLTYACGVWGPRRPKKMVYKDNKAPFVLEIDDETDEDIISALLEDQPPPGTSLNTHDSSTD